MIGALLPSLVPILGDVLDRVIPDKGEREKVKAEMTTKILEQEAKIVEAMATVMSADAASSNKLTSAARPIVVYWALSMISLLTLLGITGEADGALKALQGVPEAFWTLLTVGIGAFSVTRGLEKSVREWKK